MSQAFPRSGFGSNCARLVYQMLSGLFVPTLYFKCCWGLIAPNFQAFRDMWRRPILKLVCEPMLAMPVSESFTRKHVFENRFAGERFMVQFPTLCWWGRGARLRFRATGASTEPTEKSAHGLQIHLLHFGEFCM